MNWFSPVFTGLTSPKLTLGTYGPVPFIQLPLKIRLSQATSHWHIIGTSGSGKSYFLAQLFLSLLQHGLPVEGQVRINFDPTQFFNMRETAARRHKYSYEHRFWIGVNFGRDLMLRRAKVQYREDLQISLHYLFVKSFNDLLAAVSVSKSGYPFQSWPLIRGGFEAAELMEHLHRYPEDTTKWINKEKRFDSLRWLRHELPKSEIRRSFYNTVNDSTSTLVNLRSIDAFSTLRSDEKGIRYLSVGPNPNPIEEPNPIGLVSIIISYPIRVLWQSDPMIMDSTWVARFHSFDAEADFPFGEAWDDTKEIE